MIEVKLLTIKDGTNLNQILCKKYGDNWKVLENDGDVLPNDIVKIEELPPEVVEC